MRPPPPGTLLALTLLCALGLVISSAAAVEARGPQPWEIGMEWFWESDDVEEASEVDDHTRIQTPAGLYDAWRTTTLRHDDEGTVHRLTMWVEDDHRRIYDEVTMRQADGAPVTAMVEYTPPAPFPMWGGIQPCAQTTQEIKESISYRQGFTPAGSQRTTWNWTASASCDVFEMDTPAGALKGFNVTVYKEEVDGEDSELYRYFYAPEARHYVATYMSGEVDMRLVDYDLDPPPIAIARASTTMAQPGEEVTLSARASYALAGEIDGYEWRVPAGVTLGEEPLQEALTVVDPAFNVTFEDPTEDTYRFELTVTATNNRSARDIVTVLITEGDEGAFTLNGPPFTFTDEATEFLLSPPEGGTITDATWEAEGIDPVTGTNPEIVFPQAGSHTVRVTFTDSEGTTDHLAHDIVVIEGFGQAAATRDDATALEGQQLGPSILFPENGTTMASAEVLIVARTAGLEDPKLLLPNGLRVPLETHENVDAATVPLPRAENAIQLLDGDEIVDQVLVHHDETTDDPSPEAATEDEAQPVPFPWLVALIIAPFLRRRPS